jgi:hypothetical protein
MEWGWKASKQVGWKQTETQKEKESELLSVIHDLIMQSSGNFLPFLIIQNLNKKTLSFVHVKAFDDAFLLVSRAYSKLINFFRSFSHFLFFINIYPRINTVIIIINRCDFSFLTKSSQAKNYLQMREKKFFNKKLKHSSIKKVFFTFYWWTFFLLGKH